MDGRTWGYVRVSTKNQNEDRQIIAMREYGIAEEWIAVEKQSGRDFDRPVYRELVKKLRAGDTLVIKSVDRLGRNYTEILDEWRVLSRERGVSIVVLDMPLLNTGENQELVWKLVTDLVLQIFSYAAENERENIRTRQADGIAAAKARGVQFGRLLIPTPENFGEIAALWRENRIASGEAARRLGFSPNTFYRRIREAGLTRESPDSVTPNPDAPDVSGAELESAPDPLPCDDFTETVNSCSSIFQESAPVFPESVSNQTDSVPDCPGSVPVVSGTETPRQEQAVRRTVTLCADANRDACNGETHDRERHAGKNHAKKRHTVVTAAPDTRRIAGVRAAVP